ncbi:TetR/AcrR family transcriptional regulator [Micromonospora mirobrigensis]|uniref:Transcriptional regulator, TetR family n=1 Tax=Micromonospora mirobrigensis TaxID=262898 RepID=A0A1C4VAC6_9ACTN|nr:TetR family transcriptional regulator [Micromonospora mirobrigensis]SCE80927.1 transcriptional regulator, TetR family [Micromonospora mirobrigensis]
MGERWPRDAEQTRRRLLDAARDEFAAVGIAGARVDRIAAAAGSNKAQIYHYFGSKDGLFDAVFEEIARTTVDEIPIDATDLPGYAGRLFDSYRQRPWVQRLATWYRLERGADSALEIIRSGNSAKIAAIAAAQADGTVPDTFTPEELLGLVLHLSGFWSATTPEYAALVDGIDPGRRREVVVLAVAALVGPPPGR